MAHPAGALIPDHFASLLSWLGMELTEASIPAAALAATGPAGPLADAVWLAGQRVDAAPLFRIGSLSKLVTAVGLHLAEAHGHLRLSDRLTRHLPELESVAGLGGTTLDDLVQQRSPLWQAEGERLRGPTGRYLAPPAMPGARLLRAVAGHRYRPSGRGHGYSDYAIALAGLALGRAAGVGYGAFVRQTLLRRHGLDDLYPGTACVGDIARILSGHLHADGPPTALRRDFGALDPAFGGVATAAGVNRFLHRLMTGALLPARLTRRFHAFPVPFGPIDAGYRYGRSLVRFPLGPVAAGEACFGHLAIFGGFCGFAAHHPSSGVTVTLLMNALSSARRRDGARAEPNPAGFVRHVFGFADAVSAVAVPPLWRAPSA